MFDFQPSTSFSFYYKDIIEGIKENSKAIEAGEKDCFTFVGFAPDEYEAEAWAFIDVLNKHKAENYFGIVENDDGLLIITVTSKRPLMRRFMHRLKYRYLQRSLLRNGSQPNNKPPVSKGPVTGNSSLYLNKR